MTKPKRPSTAPPDAGFDWRGQRLPHTPPDVRSELRLMTEDGEILGLVLRRGDGIGLRIFQDQPIPELPEILEQIARSYRRLLNGETH